MSLDVGSRLVLQGFAPPMLVGVRNVSAQARLHPNKLFRPPLGFNILGCCSESAVRSRYKDCQSGSHHVPQDEMGLLSLQRGRFLICNRNLISVLSLLGWQFPFLTPSLHLDLTFEVVFVSLLVIRVLVQCHMKCIACRAQDYALGLLTHEPPSSSRFSNN